MFYLATNRLKEYFYLSKAGFYLQQTLVNSGVGRTEEKSRRTTGVNAVYPQGNCITFNMELIKNACLSTIKSLRLDKAFTFPVQKLVCLFSFQDEAIRYDVHTAQQYLSA